MVLDPQPAVTAPNTSRLSSIDAGVVQQMFGDDLTLFKSVLGRTLRDYADLALPTGASFADDAARNLHIARA